MSQIVVYNEVHIARVARDKLSRGIQDTGTPEPLTLQRGIAIDEKMHNWPPKNVPKGFIWR
jgi:hypothetical protein